MWLLALACVLGTVCSFARAAAAPDGVGPESRSLYTAAAASGEFTCADGSKTLSASAVNDDYCDCPDSSDEPGTNACPGGKFWCENAGFKGEFVASYRVNDGVCDCCDGSDEWLKRPAASGDGSACGANCAVFAEEANRAIKEQITVARAGLELRTEAVLQAHQQREAAATELATAHVELGQILPGFEALEAQHKEFVAAEDARVARDSDELAKVRAAEPDAAQPPPPPAPEPEPEPAPAPEEAAPEAAAAEAASKEEEHEGYSKWALDYKKGKGGEAAAKGAEAAPATADAEAAPAEAAPWTGAVGDLVEADYQDLSEWLPGTVEAVEGGDGGEKLYTVKYDDGEREEKLPAARVRARVPVCSGTIEGLVDDATSACEEKNAVGATCKATCVDGYAGGDADFKCELGGKWAGQLACTLLAPTTPYVEKVTAKDGALSVEFATAVQGGVAEYSITATPAAPAEPMTTTLSSGDSPADVSGLTNGVEYTVGVEVSNAAGKASAQAYSAVAPSAARATFEASDEKKKEVEAKLEALKAKAEIDLGPDNVFATMIDKTVETADDMGGSFKYRLDLFHKSEQSDRGSWVNIGNWVGFDEDHSIMKFAEGDGPCPNGKRRSSTVKMVCGDKDQLSDVVEAEMCAYAMVMTTPLVCKPSDVPQLLGEPKQDL